MQLVHKSTFLMLASISFEVDFDPAQLLVIPCWKRVHIINLTILLFMFLLNTHTVHHWIASMPVARLNMKERRNLRFEHSSDYHALFYFNYNLHVNKGVNLWAPTILIVLHFSQEISNLILENINIVWYNNVKSAL